MLIVLHQEHSIPGHVGLWLQREGYPLDIRRPRFGCPLPETLDEHAGAVIFGGPMSANDPDDYVKVETDWIGVALEEKRPFLGICLGAQMLANHLGGTVGFNPDKICEIGHHQIEATPAGRALCAWPRTVYQWHREGFSLPRDCTLLAKADSVFPNQAFSYGPAAAAIQFHPEITFEMVHRWSGSNPERLKLPGAKPRPSHLEGHIKHRPAVGRWLDTFMRLWLAGALQPQTATRQPAPIPAL